MIKKTATEISIEEFEKEGKKHLHQDFISKLTEDIANIKRIQINFEMMYGVKLNVKVEPMEPPKGNGFIPESGLDNIINNFLK